MPDQEWGKTPIIRDTLEHTGRLDGDDSGYRDVEISLSDGENPDPMVIVTDVATRPLYAVGATPGLCVYYPGGIGGPDKVLVRKPVAEALVRVDQMLAPYNRKLLVVDGWRPWWVQAALWKYLRAQIIGALGLEDGNLSIQQEVEIGLKADDVGSYCALVQDQKFEIEMAYLMDRRGNELSSATAALGKDVNTIATLYLTFEANLGRNELKIAEDAITAHGNGGSVDTWMLDNDGRYVNLGVPFDYVPCPGTQISPAVMNYFEMVTPAEFREQVARDVVLQQYFAELGIAIVTDFVFAQARRERRILYHAMREVGASYFSLSTDLGEPWHFNVGNELGGNQFGILPGSGNGCHALLKNVRSAETGKPMAVWSNSVGHALAKKLLNQ